MKVSYAHVALVAVSVSCGGPTALAFVLPAAAVARPSSTPCGRPTPASNGQVSTRPLRATVARIRPSPLAAAREDCKSCMEAELLEEEMKKAGKGDKAKGVAARRAALEEVCSAWMIDYNLAVDTERKSPVRFAPRPTRRTTLAVDLSRC